MFIVNIANPIIEEENSNTRHCKVICQSQPKNGSEKEGTATMGLNIKTFDSDANFFFNFQSTPTMQEETGSSMKIQQLTPPNAMVLPTGPNPVYTKRSLAQDMRSQENTHLPFNNLSEVSAKFPHHQVTRPNHGELVQHGLVPNNSHVSQHPQHQYHQQIAS